MGLGLAPQRLQEALLAGVKSGDLDLNKTEVLQLCHHPSLVTDLGKVVRGERESAAGLAS